ASRPLNSLKQKESPPSAGFLLSVFLLSTVFKYPFKYTAGAIILDDFLIEQAKLTSRSNGPPTID
ncbi:hypothetical protein, partial [Pseudomonas viridiflava]|uniref:hypothetical protein n=1 Tax=Pseudomonas viridiflava TaxID=33069 RepID=UPI001E2FF193